MSTEDIEDVYELSPLQQGLLYLSVTDETDGLHLNQRSFLIEGPLDTQLLEHAWRSATDAHSSMRTSYHWDDLDSPVQVVHRKVETPIVHVDWSSEATVTRPGRDVLDDTGGDSLSPGPRLRTFLTEDLGRRFALETAPLQRVAIIRVAEESHIVVWTHHLLALDGWSVPLFVNDVLSRYRAMTSESTVTTPPPPPYREYIAWLRSQSMDAAETFWRQRNTSPHDATIGPAELRSDPALENVTVRRCSRRLTETHLASLREFAALHRVTLNTTLQAGWALTLDRHGTSPQVCFGVTCSSRPPELPGADRMTGLFTNTLPLQVEVPPTGDLGEWLGTLQRDYTAIRRYDFAPLAEIKKWVGAPGLTPLFQSLFVVDNYSLAVGVENLGAQVSVRPIDSVERTSIPLVLTATPGNGLQLHLIYRADLLPACAAEEIITDLVGFLTDLPRASRIEDVTRSPSQPAPTLQHRPSANPRITWPGQTLASLVARQCAASPDAPAVLDGPHTVSYAELLAHANTVARALAARDLGPGDTVGICLQRSWRMVVTIVGITLSGAAYLPLEPSLPPARMGYMVRTGDAGLILTDADSCEVALTIDDACAVVVLEDLLNSPPPLVPVPAPRRDDPAYVIFTSGSTGAPKGVMVTHASAVHRIAWAQEAIPLASGDRVLQKTPYGFDVSVWEFFWPLITGATLVMTRPEGHQDAAYLAEIIAREDITVAHFVPSMLRLFLEEPTAAHAASLAYMLCSGEALPQTLADRAHELLPETRILNLYGPTEAAIDVTWWDCSWPSARTTASVPIGRTPVGVEAYILDSRLRHTPPAVPGELYLAGVQLARGYASNASLTAATFVANPWAEGERMYRTGDRVQRSDGVVEFLGRTDTQVKIHGYRIELGEIEAAILAHPAIRDAIVLHHPQRERLVAHVTANSAAFDAAELRGHLRHTLPTYMLPAVIHTESTMPLTLNGKLDRAALISRLETNEPDVALAKPPSTRTNSVPAAQREPEADGEAHIAGVFADILDLSDVDRTASFFELGGNSFDAVRAVRRIDGATVGLLGAFPTPRSLAHELAATDAAARTLLRLGPAHSSARPLLCVPFGGGSAITYRPLADALHITSDLTLYALAQPGHELAGDDLVSIDAAAAMAVEAALRVTDGPIPVYGHCAGVALAVEVARRLERAGREVPRLFLAASYPFTAPGPAGRFAQRVLSWLIGCGLARVGPRTIGLATGDSTRLDRAEYRYLRSLGGFNADLEPDELRDVMRAFRHDVSSAGTYFSESWPHQQMPDPTPPLRCPITVITGAEDPLTPQPERNHRLWRRFGSSVDLAQLPGGHYFHQEHPELVAEVLIRGLAVVDAAAELGETATGGPGVSSSGGSA